MPTTSQLSTHAARFPFRAAPNLHQLSLNKGQSVFILDRSTNPDWWLVSLDKKGKTQGLVPSNYLEWISKAAPPLLPYSTFSPSFRRLLRQDPTPIPTGLKQEYRARYPFLAQRPGQLSLQKREALYVLDSHSDPNWWFVQKDQDGHTTGFVPSNHLAVIGVLLPPPPLPPFPCAPLAPAVSAVVPPPPITSELLPTAAPFVPAAAQSVVVASGPNDPVVTEEGKITFPPLSPTFSLQSLATSDVPSSMSISDLTSFAETARELEEPMHAFFRPQARAPPTPSPAREHPFPCAPLISAASTVIPPPSSTSGPPPTSAPFVAATAKSVVAKPKDVMVIEEDKITLPPPSPTFSLQSLATSDVLSSVFISDFISFADTTTETEEPRMLSPEFRIEALLSLPASSPPSPSISLQSLATSDVPSESSIFMSDLTSSYETAREIEQPTLVSPRPRRVEAPPPTSPASEAEHGLWSEEHQHQVDGVPRQFASRHVSFYLEDGNVRFLIGDKLFNVHSHFFKKHSPGLLAVGQDLVTLNDVDATDFERLLTIFYPGEFLEDELTSAAEWTSVLVLASFWDMNAIRRLAINRLETLLADDPVERIVLGRTPGWDNMRIDEAGGVNCVPSASTDTAPTPPCSSSSLSSTLLTAFPPRHTLDIEQWLFGAYKQLVLRSSILTENEARRLGFRDVLKVWEGQNSYKHLPEMGRMSIPSAPPLHWQRDPALQLDVMGHCVDGVVRNIFFPPPQAEVALDSGRTVCSPVPYRPSPGGFYRRRSEPPSRSLTPEAVRFPGPFILRHPLHQS